MKNILLYLPILFFAISCNNNNSHSANNTNPDKETSNDSKGNNYWQKMVMHEVKDNSGMVAAILPLPATWKLNNPPQNGISITGPNGIKITDFAPVSFMMNYDQNLQHAYNQSGQKMRSMPPIDQLIQEDVVPSAAKRGLQYLKFEELKEVSKMDKWYSDQLYKTGPAETFVKAFGIDWKDKNGNPAFTILHVNSSKGQYGETWYYMASLLEAEKEMFELAKKQFIFALANTRYNLEPIMAYNKAEAERIGQSWAAFNKRMAQNQANFEAQQLAHVNKSNAINDAIMNNWKSSNAASDKNQEQFIDRIYENEKVQNTETGQTYKVQQGSNQYWMNNNGEYIGTKSNTYDPNLDDNMNEQKWQELKKVD